MTPIQKCGFTRRELYDRVWSEPKRTIAQALGISDVALAKACRKANIPVPERGYWPKRQAGVRAGPTLTIVPIQG